MEHFQGQICVMYREGSGETAKAVCYEQITFAGSVFYAGC